MQAPDLTFTSRTLPALFEDGDPHFATKHFERTHTDLLDRTYAAIARGDTAQLRELLSPGVTFSLEGFPHMDGEWQGFDAVMDAIVRNFSLLEKQQVAFEQLCAQGSQLVLRFRESGRFRPTGESYSGAVIQWFEMADGRITALRQFAAVRFTPPQA